jgi:broad specificity phosphatase PhoE
MGSECISEEQRQALSALSFDTSHFDAIYCSPAQRCRETAEALGIGDPIVEPRLAERGFGIFDGLTAQQCRDRYSAEFDAFLVLDGTFVIPGGESRAQHLDRIASWLEDVAHHAAVLAVTHGGTIDFLYRLGTGQPVHGGSTVFAGPNAARSIFDVTWPNVSVIEHGMPLV